MDQTVTPVGMAALRNDGPSEWRADTANGTIIVPPGPHKIGAIV